MTLGQPFGCAENPYAAAQDGVVINDAYLVRKIFQGWQSILARCASLRLQIVPGNPPAREAQHKTHFESLSEWQFAQACAKDLPGKVHQVACTRGGLPRRRPLFHDTLGSYGYFDRDRVFFGW